MNVNIDKTLAGLKLDDKLRAKLQAEVWRNHPARDVIQQYSTNAGEVIIFAQYGVTIVVSTDALQDFWKEYFSAIGGNAMVVQKMGSMTSMTSATTTNALPGAMSTPATPTTPTTPITPYVYPCYIVCDTKAPEDTFEYLARRAWGIDTEYTIHGVQFLVAGRVHCATCARDFVQKVRLGDFFCSSIYSWCTQWRRQTDESLRRYYKRYFARSHRPIDYEEFIVNCADEAILRKCPELLHKSRSKYKCLFMLVRDDMIFIGYSTNPLRRYMIESLAHRVTMEGIVRAVSESSMAHGRIHAEGMTHNYTHIVIDDHLLEDACFNMWKKVDSTHKAMLLSTYFGIDEDTEYVDRSVVAMEQ